MDTQAYIDSGILQDYSMGLLTEAEMVEVEELCTLYPAVRNELERIQKTLERYVSDSAIEPPASLQDTIWATLNNLNKEGEMNADDLPLINRFTDHNKWLRFVRDRIPPQVTEDRVMETLQHNEHIMQAFVISKTDFENEEHVDEMESFIILEGECECTIGDNVFRLGPGGFTEIPLHTPHTVRMLTPYVVAILQRVAV